MFVIWGKLCSYEGNLIYNQFLYIKVRLSNSTPDLGICILGYLGHSRKTYLKIWKDLETSG
jgi:hypothetical protein